jgi:hypothetical protein
VNQEGYRDYTFGGRAGPSVEFDNLCHELAHAAQFGPEMFDARCTAGGGYHFPVREISIGGEMCEEPATPQCSLREIETFAIQYQLMRYVGCRPVFDQYAKQVVSICSFLPDWWTLGGIEGRKTQIPVLLAQFTDQWSPARAIARITAWLDLTEKRLTLSKCEA